MFNRHGKRLSIEHEFATALGSLRNRFSLARSRPCGIPLAGGEGRGEGFRDVSPLTVHQSRFPITWLDVECLERRHNVGRGSLIVLDLPDEAANSYSIRRELLADLFDVAPDPGEFLPDQVYLSPSHPHDYAPALWTLLKAVNARVPDFYEGLVAKRADSTYPVQLHSPDYEFHAWMKHRWRF
jgi:hypothetical protein